MRDSYLASCGFHVKIHDPITYEVLDTYGPTVTRQESHGTKTDISWSVDGKCLAVLPGNGPVQIMHLKEDKLLYLSSAFVETITPTAVSYMTNCNRYLAIGTKRGIVIVWDCKKKEVRKSFSSPEHQGEVQQVHFNTSDKQIAAIMSTSEILIYDYLNNTTNVKMTLQVPNSKMSAVCFRDPGRKSLLAGGTKEGNLSCWNTMNGNVIYTASKCHSESINDVAFSRVNHDLLASVSSDRDLCIHSLSSGPKATLRVSTVHPLATVDLSTDGNVAILGTTSGHLLTYDLRSYRQPLFSEQMHDSVIRRVRFSPDARKETNGSLQASAAEEVQTSQATTNVQPRFSQDMLDSFELFSPVGASRSQSMLQDASQSFTYPSSFNTDTSMSPQHQQDIKPNLSTLQANSSTPNLQPKLENCSSQNSSSSTFDSTPIRNDNSHSYVERSGFTNSLISPLAVVRLHTTREENIFASNGEIHTPPHEPLNGHVDHHFASGDGLRNKNMEEKLGGLTEAVSGIVAGMKMLEMRMMDLEDNVLAKMNELDARIVMKGVLAKEKEKDDQALEITRLKEENFYLKQLLRKQT